MKLLGEPVREKATLTFYDVKQCGYYKTRKTTPEFGTYKEIISDLLKWTKNSAKPLSETSTYEPDQDDDFLRTYCLDMQVNSGGDCVLITWNETPTYDGRVASVDGSELVGIAEVKTSSLPSSTSIPGYPSYFWLMPDSDLLATVQFGEIRNGHVNFDRYMTGFLQFYSQKVNSSTSSDGLELHGYQASPTAVVQSLDPRFVSRLHRNPSEIEYLKAHVSQIRKIIRNQTLQSKSNSHRSLWHKLLRRIEMIDPPPLAEDVKMTYQINMTPTLAQFEEIVAGYKKDKTSETQDNWQDTGFVLAGNADKTYWLSSIKARTDIEIDIERGPQNIVAAVSMLSALSSNKSHLIKSVK